GEHELATRVGADAHLVGGEVEDALLSGVARDEQTGASRAPLGVRGAVGVIGHASLLRRCRGPEGPGTVHSGSVSIRRNGSWATLRPLRTTSEGLDAGCRMCTGPPVHRATRSEGRRVRGGGRR